MTVKELVDSKIVEVEHIAQNADVEIQNVYCCDMLSFAMSKMPQKAAWVTIISNVNALAVATLMEASCIILAEGVQLDNAAKNKLLTEDITVLKSKKPIFEIAHEIYKRIS